LISGGNFTWEAKEKVVAQVARDLTGIFELRFTTAGLLSLSSDQEYVVGSIVVPKYFEIMDGRPAYTNSFVQQSLHQFRGLFSNATDWLSSSMKAEMFASSSTPSPSPPPPTGFTTHHEDYGSSYQPVLSVSRKSPCRGRRKNV
jgi:hypothetical protein